jgi:site-specific DNA-methyltransferase (adenine-specific)
MATLLQGDCLEVMKTLPDKSVDCFICDLPYGCLSINGKPKVSDEKALENGKGRIPAAPGGCSWDLKIDLSAFWEQVKRLAKDDHTPVLMFCNTKFGIDLINSNPSWFRYDLVWNKQRGISFLLANKQPMKSHEMIYVFGKKGAYYKRIDEDSDKGAWEKEKRGDNPGSVYVFDDGGKPASGVAGKRCSLSVINLRKPASYQLKGTHPTEKPLDLYTWLLERYCPAGGTVLDPTAGSFNSIKAAVALGLKGIGIEKDDGFFKKAETAFGVADISGDTIHLID